jgi:hypothetical protein
MAGPMGGLVFSMVAKALGGDIKNPEQLIETIKSDPDAAFKLTQLQAQHEQELWRLALEEQRIQNADVADARNQNTKNIKITDEIIKLWLVFVVSAIVFMCLNAVTGGKVEGQEYAIVISLLSSAMTIIISMVGFYWGGVVKSKSRPVLSIVKTKKIEDELPFPSALSKAA